MKHDALHFYTIELLTFLMHLKKKKKKKLFLFKSHKCVKKKPFTQGSHIIMHMLRRRINTSTHTGLWGGGKAYLLWIKDIPYQLPHRGAGNEGIYSNERAAFGDKPRKTKPN